MNQKNVVIASGVLALVLVTGCSGSDRYEYGISGKVQEQQIDYDCPGESLSMEPIGFVGKTTGGSGGRSSSSRGGSSSKGNSDSSSGSSGGSSGGSDANIASKKPSKPENRGVRLDKKPDSPQKVKKVKKPAFNSKPTTCDNEYEIFVIDSKGDLYEQDVRQVDYDKCLSAKIPSGQKVKLFPLCTKG